MGSPGVVADTLETFLKPPVSRIVPKNVKGVPFGVGPCEIRERFEIREFMPNSIRNVS